MRHPKVFLLDEPLSNLDARLRGSMRAEISRLHRRLGATMIYVTHDQIEAMTLGQRIVVLRDGVIQQVDTPMALYRQPANLFVATFIGSPAMNLIEATARRDGDRLFAETEDGLHFPLADCPVTEGTAVTVGIRPEHLNFVSGDTPGALPLAIDLIEPTGHETHVFGRLGHHQVVVIHSERVAETSSAFVAVAPGSIHLFDRASGRRIERI